jgi:hypothetical protein
VTTTQAGASSGNSAPGPDIAQFEALDVSPSAFDHEAHIYVAWSYLRELDPLTSIDRYRSVLRRLTAKLGVPDKYHETITWFYLLAVAERAIGNAATDWNVFKRRNPELFQRNPGLIRNYYSESRLMSDTARQQFVLPDLSPTANQ